MYHWRQSAQSQKYDRANISVATEVIFANAYARLVDGTCFHRITANEGSEQRKTTTKMSAGRTGMMCSIRVPVQSSGTDIV